MLSTPPAFVLSQNQTLKFNCLKPSVLSQVPSAALTFWFFCLLLTVLLGYICYYIFSQKINWQKHFCSWTLSYSSLFQFIFFYSIFNLRRQTFRLPECHLAIAYLSYHIRFPLSSVFYIFFKIFFALHCSVTVFISPRSICLLILPLCASSCQLFFMLFSKKNLKFSLFLPFTIKRDE